MSKLWRANILGFLGVLGVALLLVSSSVFAQSQATTGVIEGTVTDEDGGVLPGATITLRNTATNYEQVVTTGENGRFRALLLPLGPYRITVTLDGFATLIREGIDLAVGQTINLPLELRRGVEEEITVTGEAPVIETSRTEGAVRIDTQAIENLPNNGRNFLDYTKLTPGVTIVQGPDGDELSINGQKGIANNISVDGTLRSPRCVRPSTSIRRTRVRTSRSRGSTTTRASGRTALRSARRASSSPSVRSASSCSSRIGDVMFGKLNDRAGASKAFTQALEEKPDDRKLLTKMMQLYSEEKDWAKLVDVVLRLADFVEDPKQRAKYMHTAAAIRSLVRRWKGTASAGPRHETR